MLFFFYFLLRKFFDIWNLFEKEKKKVKKENKRREALCRLERKYKMAKVNINI